MNKYKKIAVAAVSVVMAGAMALPLAACKKDSGNGGGGSSNGIPFVADGDLVTAARPDHITKVNPAQAFVQPSNNSGVLSYTSGTSLEVAIGYNNAKTGIRYNADNVSKVGDKTIMGQTPSLNTLKPAWSALQTKLGVSFTDKYEGKSASENISFIKTQTGGLGAITALTASATTINGETAGTFLDMSQYLDYMPNYKAFLAANPVVWASLIADAQSGAMYMVPYFDGNNDIEKFVLLRKDLVETLLNGKTNEDLTKTVTFAAQAAAKNGGDVELPTDVVGTSSSAASFMGTTGSWEIDVTDPSKLTEGEHAWGNDKTAVSDSTSTVKVKVNYDAALTAAKNGEHALGQAISEAAGKAYDGESGNIVDLQNFAINETNGAVTGGQLLKILRAYIDVAYTDASGASFYATANSGLKRASVFNSASAAWDVDLYTALGRCFVTSGTLLGENVKDVKDLYLISGREYTTQRNTDVASLAGELFGVRGLESRSMNYTYINSQGDIADARSNPNTWIALSRMNDLAKEGLLSTVDNVKGGWSSLKHSSNTGIQTLSLHDYVQTQTANYGFTAADGNEYNFAPVLTPVSVWNVDGKSDTQVSGRTDGKEEIMRFTESWRGVKDGGLAIPYDNVKNDANKLAAALAFVDYCYSSDGQMLMTYGPMASGKTATDGLWYATEATGVSINNIVDATKTIATAGGLAQPQYTLKTTANSGANNKTAKESYFIYEGKVYTGTFYNGRQIPSLTDENKDVFNTKSGHSFTGHARELLGTTLPLWNKDQGFEYLCTAPCGLAGSDIVNIAINNGTIKHQFQTLNGTDDYGNYVGGGSAASPNYWYTLCPTVLPFSSARNTSLGSAPLKYISGKGADNNNLFVSTSKTKRNLITDIMYYGFAEGESIAYVADESFTLPGGPSEMVAFLNGESVGLSTLVRYKRDAWFGLLDWYNNTYAS